MNAPVRLQARSEIALRAPGKVLALLQEHFAEHGEVSVAGETWTVEFEIGRASASLLPSAILFQVEADDASSLSFLQWSVAEHVGEFAPGEEPVITWNGGTEPGKALPYFREMRVVRAKQVTPLLRRLTLSGSDLERFARSGLHVRLLLPPRPGVLPVWPMMAADGRQAWPDGERPAIRIYTLRRIDVAEGEVDIDFVIHEGDEMPGARFGIEAAPGDVVGMMGPGGGTLKAASSYLFLGDETALPAIARMLEELPPEANARAFIEIADAAEAQQLPTRSGVDVQWLSREGRPAGSTNLLAETLRSALPDMPGTMSTSGRQANIVSSARCGATSRSASACRKSSTSAPPIGASGSSENCRTDARVGSTTTLYCAGDLTGARPRTE